MCDDMPPVLPLWDFFDILIKPHGMERIGTEIRRLKGDLRGRRIPVLPSMWAFGRWESKWKNVLSPYSLREARRQAWHVAFVGIFDPFIALHNFTFDTIGKEAQAAMIRNNTATMRMSIKFENNGIQYQSPTLSLFGFNHYHSYFFTTITQSDPARLSSVTAPFSDLAGALILLTLLALTTTMLLLALGNRRCFWDTPETALLVVSGLVGQSWSMNGNSRFLLFYISWLFLAGFISIMYTNILQSVVVVPGIRFNRLTFEEMVHRKYTFESLAVEPLKSNAKRLATESPKSTRMSVIEAEMLLADLVEERCEMFNSTWIKIIQRYNEASKRAAIGSIILKQKFKKAAKTFGWDVVVGQEQFFNDPSWWSFQNMERGSLLAHSIERLKQLGFVTYFKRLWLEKMDKVFETSLRRDCIHSTDKHEICRMDSAGSSVPLGDPLVSEPLLLLLYGMCIATAAFMGEIVAKLFIKIAGKGFSRPRIDGTGRLWGHWPANK